MNSVILVSIESGLIFSLLAIGVVMTFKILDIADLSVEGTFPFGAFVLTRLLITGLNPFIGTTLSFFAGCFAGFITYLLFKKVRIESILAGILTMTLLYSVNLRITGKSNVTFFEFDTVFSLTEGIPKILFLGLIVLAIKLVIDWFLSTEQGYLLLITGDNESLVKALGKNPDIYTMIGLMLSNGLASLSGSLMAQYQGFTDITMGQTMIVTALASIIIGDAVLRHSKWLKLTTRAIIGAVVYRLVYGVALHLGLEPNDLKGITAIIVILFIGYNNLSTVGLNKYRNRKEKRNATD
ncbi:MAG: ABC transporter permease [Tissierellia bacterium]|nr:ABC transporter permease [Tissierellia bacterium]